MKLLRFAAIIGLSIAIPQRQTPDLSGNVIDGSCNTATPDSMDKIKDALSRCMEISLNAAQLVLDENNEAAAQKIRERFGIEPDSIYRQRIHTQYMNFYNSCAGNLNTTHYCSDETDERCTKRRVVAYACGWCAPNGYITVCPNTFIKPRPAADCWGSSIAAVLVHETSHNFGESDADGAGKFQRLAAQLMPECINLPWPGGEKDDPMKRGQKPYATHEPATLYDRNGPVATPTPGPAS